MKEGDTEGERNPSRQIRTPACDKFVLRRRISSPSSRCSISQSKEDRSIQNFQRYRHEKKSTARLREVAGSLNLPFFLYIILHRGLKCFGCKIRFQMHAKAENNLATSRTGLISNLLKEPGSSVQGIAAERTEQTVVAHLCFRACKIS